jgi:hypothetical protein
MAQPSLWRNVPLVGSNPTRPLISWFERVQIRLGLMQGPVRAPSYESLPPLTSAERSVKILQLEKHLRSHGGLRLAAAWLVDLSHELAAANAQNAAMESVLHFKREYREYLAKHPELRPGGQA